MKSAKYRPRRPRPPNVTRLISRRTKAPTGIILVAIAAIGGISSLAATTPEKSSVTGGLAVASPEPIIGVASVVDGDTIEIHGQRIRFSGIDAPESTQICRNGTGKKYRCGQKSAKALDVFLAASQPTRCTFVAWDKYQRFVGNCERADGASVAGWMVANGHALDWPKYSQGAYAAQEAKAKAARVGMWAGKFQAPWDWRAANMESAPQSQPLGLVDQKQVAQSGYSCSPRRTCSRIASCDEARWYLENCPWGGKLDRDKDGIPCESLC